MTDLDHVYFAADCKAALVAPGMRTPGFTCGICNPALQAPSGRVYRFAPGTDLQLVGHALADLVEHAGWQVIVPDGARPGPGAVSSRTCGVCLRNTAHPEDVRHGWCSYCNTFTIAADPVRFLALTGDGCVIGRGDSVEAAADDGERNALPGESVTVYQVAQ